MTCILLFGQGGCQFMSAMDRSGIQLVALVKDLTGERYIFLYDDTDAGSDEAIQVIGQFANNPNLSLTWDDAATLARKIRLEREKSRSAIGIKTLNKNDQNNLPLPPQDPWRKPK